MELRLEGIFENRLRAWEWRQTAEIHRQVLRAYQMIDTSPTDENRRRFAFCEYAIADALKMAEEAEQQALALERLIDRLPDTHERQVLRLRYVDGLGYDQIAARLMYSISSVFNIRKRALDNLSRLT